MNITHISIPFDELELFKDDDQYQNYLVETLIYSTKVTLHSNTRKVKAILVLTKNTLWLEEETNKKKKIQLPIKFILQIIKAEEHPELVLLTQDNEDNLRISTANDQRALNIISALAFYFTYLSPQKQGIKVYSIKQNSLLYFERTVKEKKSGPKLNLDRYNKAIIFYVENKDSPDIFGKIIIHKMVLAKQLYVEGPHMIHLAEINDKEQYFCHTLNKSAEVIETIAKHRNLEFVQKLEYAKKLQFKVQLFFEYLPALKPKSIKLTDLFEQLYKIYDLMKQYKKDAFITPEMLLRCQDSKKLMVREFRYPFLLIDHEYSAFIYRKIQVQKSQSDYITNKLYNIGLLMYQHLFGRVLFQHEDLDFTLYLKNSMKEVPFPKGICIGCSKKVQTFIENCILGRYQTQQHVKADPWIQLNKINI